MKNFEYLIFLPFHNCVQLWSTICKNPVCVVLVSLFLWQRIPPGDVVGLIVVSTPDCNQFIIYGGFKELLHDLSSSDTQFFRGNKNKHFLLKKAISTILVIKQLSCSFSMTWPKQNLFTMKTFLRSLKQVPPPENHRIPIIRLKFWSLLFIGGIL